MFWGTLVTKAPECRSGAVSAVKLYDLQRAILFWSGHLA